MSAIGSVMVIACQPFSPRFLALMAGPTAKEGYQEALETPGSSPRCAISRMHTRHRPNLRYTALGRPQRWQRVYARTANLGFAAALRTSAFFAIGQFSLVLTEREAEQLEQRATFLVRASGGDHGDVHPSRPVDAVLVDLVEHRLLGETERVVAVAVELAPVEAAEVADTRERDRQQPVQELPHAVVAQGDLGADRHALPQLELRDRLGRAAHLRLLAGDRGQVPAGAVD